MIPFFFALFSELQPVWKDRIRGSSCFGGGRVSQPWGSKQEPVQDSELGYRILFSLMNQ